VNSLLDKAYVNNIAAKPALLRAAYWPLYPALHRDKNAAQRDAAFQNEALGCTLPPLRDSKMELLAGMTLF
jgi:hypothetical protein